MVFGAIGILLTTAVIVELPVHAQAAKRNAAHPLTTDLAASVNYGAGNSFDPKPR
jgi:hypothetical protein